MTDKQKRIIYFAHNLWTNWFFDEEAVDSMQTIDIDSILESED